MSKIILPGIDKIWLQTQDFRVKDGEIFGYKRNTEPGEGFESLPKLFVDESGTIYQGQQAKYEGKYGKKGIDYFLGINQRGLSLQFNPSKIIHPYNLTQDTKQIESIGKEISKELNELGICFDLSKTRPTRIDFAKQDFLQRPIENYMPVFGYLEGKRMRGIAYDDTGYTFNNTRHEFCFYSKGREIQDESLYNMMRAENRLKDYSVISKSLGYNNYEIFLKSDPGHWNEHYVRYLSEKIFRKEKQGQIFDFENEVEKLKMFKESGRNALNNYLITTSLDYILLTYGNLKFLWKVMSEAGFSRQQINNEKHRIRGLLKLTGKNKVVSIGTLIDELKQKFAA